MRVLVINAMFYHKAYRKTVDELGKLPGLELTVLTVDGWMQNSLLEPTSPVAVGSPYTMVTGVTGWKGHENRGFYLTGLVKAFKVAKPDVIFLMEEPFSLFTLQTLLVRELLAKDVPVVFFTWNNLSLDDFDYRPTIWYRSVVRWTLPRMQYALTANSDAVEVLKRKHFSGPAQSIGYGVDTSIFLRSSDAEIRRMKEQLSIPADATVIGYVGRLIAMKGLDLLLPAFARLQQTHPRKKYILLMVGSGAGESAVFEQAKELGIMDSIRRVSAVTQADVPKYMSLIDTLVLPSRRSGMWAEQFGRVMVEAMAMRIAVIGSSSGSIPEIIGDAGFVFEENSSDDLFAKLCRVEALTPEERNALLDRGEYRGREHYSWHRFAQRCSEVLREVYATSVHP
jgi:glycosyltransferase involved in cell wall biosynthesis